MIIFNKFQWLTLIQLLDFMNLDKVDNICIDMNKDKTKISIYYKEKPNIFVFSNKEFNNDYRVLLLDIEKKLSNQLDKENKNG